MRREKPPFLNVHQLKSDLGRFAPDHALEEGDLLEEDLVVGLGLKCQSKIKICVLGND